MVAQILYTIVSLIVIKPIKMKCRSQEKTPARSAGAQIRNLENRVSESSISSGLTTIYRRNHANQTNQTNKTNKTNKTKLLPPIAIGLSKWLSLRRNKKPETRNQKPETRNQKQETRNQKPETTSNFPSTRSQPRVVPVAGCGWVGSP